MEPAASKLPKDIVAFIVGLLFGAGLLISGMSNPAKVLGFLDIAGDWDPSLIFVMATGIILTFIGYRLVMRRSVPLVAQRFHLPNVQRIDFSLVAGSAIFGLGWGLVGLCPGPALLDLAALRHEPVIFVIAMLAGMKLCSWIRNKATA